MARLRVHDWGEQGMAWTVTTCLEDALADAFAAAGGADVRVGGGASVLRQCLRAGLVDEMHVAIAPIVIGGVERLFDDPADSAGLTVVDHGATPSATHVVMSRP